MKASLLRLSPVLPALVGLFGACAFENAEPGEVATTTSTSAQPERWNAANDPTKIGAHFAVKVDQLPVEGHAVRVPTPGDYWPTYTDSIDARWDGDDSLSPAEKYEKAFARKGVARAVSETDGIRGQTSRKSCSAADRSCAGYEDGSACAIPRGETSGRCIPTWWGICHGWAPFAIQEPAPIKPVTRNGVTFYPGDLEALGSLVYAHGLPTASLSERCDVRSPEASDDGRVKASACRDMNPGSLHVLVANRLGLEHTGFVYDKSAKAEVWNQPAYAFKVTNAAGGKLVAIDREQAVGLVGLDVTYRTVRRLGDVVAGPPTLGSFVASADGEVIVQTSGTGDVDLFVRRNAPASAEESDCGSANPTASERCSLTVAKGDEIHYALVAFAPGARASVAVGTKGKGAAYAFNPDARGFYHVKLDLTYVSESVPARTSHVDAPDRYLAVDHLEYVLETDDHGVVLGGEWLGPSRAAHPDFAWWPTGAPTGPAARGLIRYDEVKALLEEAKGP